MKKLLAASCIIVAGMGSAFAQNVPKASTSTESFVQMCNNKSDGAAQNFCHGFGQGVYETYLISRHPKRARPFICLDKSTATRQDYIDAFVIWTGTHTQYNQMSAADTILRYLGETYPCKK
jgi:hypothetical protein